MDHRSRLKRKTAILLTKCHILNLKKHNAPLNNQVLPLRSFLEYLPKQVEDTENCK